MTESEIAEVLRKRHLPPKWAFLTNVRTRTGYGVGLAKERYIDAIAICLWPSGNYQRIVYEIKSNRSDWRSELANPIKRAQAFLLSHEFWFVLAPNVLGEPKTWWHRLEGAGIMQVKDDLSIEVISPAVKHIPFPMPDMFVASLLRNALKINAGEL